MYYLHITMPFHTIEKNTFLKRQQYLSYMGWKAQTNMPGQYALFCNIFLKPNNFIDTHSYQYTPWSPISNFLSMKKTVSVYVIFSCLTPYFSTSILG